MRPVSCAAAMDHLHPKMLITVRGDVRLLRDEATSVQRIQQPQLDVLTTPGERHGVANLRNFVSSDRAV